jgi:NTP pyrophosphatase (non-canonical NTP hydrolase)
MDQKTMETQSAEFDALCNLWKAYSALPPIVDDDYPEMRHYYERAMRELVEALIANGRCKAGTTPGDLQRIENSLTEQSKRFRTFDNQSEHSRYMALALAGEVGEMLNIIKKEWRGDPKGLDNNALLDEASDVFVYWTLFCHTRGWTIWRVMEHADQKAERKIVALEAERAKK